MVMLIGFRTAVWIMLHWIKANKFLSRWINKVVIGKMRSNIVANRSQQNYITFQKVTIRKLYDDFWM